MAEAQKAPDALSSIPRLLTRNVREFGSKPAYREKEYGIWQSWTWAETALEIEALALGFLTLGVAKGDHIAIVGRNRPRFYWSMVAAQMVGAVPVPVYQDSVAEEIAFVLDHCGARFVVVEDQEQVDKIVEVKDRLPGIEHIIYLDARGLRKYDHSAMTQYGKLQAAGREASSQYAAELDARREAIGWDDTCVMLYTSGTT
ncbi:MAG: AMP-binding protein, partial [Boseongicola sp.]